MSWSPRELSGSIQPWGSQDYFNVNDGPACENKIWVLAHRIQERRLTSCCRPQVGKRFAASHNHHAFSEYLISHYLNKELRSPYCTDRRHPGPTRILGRPHSAVPMPPVADHVRREVRIV